MTASFRVRQRIESRLGQQGQRQRPSPVRVLGQHELILLDRKTPIAAAVEAVTEPVRVDVPLGAHAEVVVQEIDLRSNVGTFQSGTVKPEVGSELGPQIVPPLPMFAIAEGVDVPIERAFQRFQFVRKPSGGSFVGHRLLHDAHDGHVGPVFADDFRHLGKKHILWKRVLLALARIALAVDAVVIRRFDDRAVEAWLLRDQLGQTVHVPLAHRRISRTIGRMVRAQLGLGDRRRRVFVSRSIRHVMDEYPDTARMRISDEILGGLPIGPEIRPDEIHVAHLPFAEPVDEVVLVEDYIAAEAVQMGLVHEPFVVVRGREQIAARFGQHPHLQRGSQRYTAPAKHDPVFALVEMVVAEITDGIQHTPRIGAREHGQPIVTLRILWIAVDTQRIALFRRIRLEESGFGQVFQRRMLVPLTQDHQVCIDWKLVARTVACFDCLGFRASDMLDMANNFRCGVLLEIIGLVRYEDHDPSSRILGKQVRAAVSRG